MSHATPAKVVDDAGCILKLIWLPVSGARQQWIYDHTSSGSRIEFLVVMSKMDCTFPSEGIGAQMSLFILLDGDISAIQRCTAKYFLCHQRVREFCTLQFYKREKCSLTIFSHDLAESD